ncbi:MAG: polyprenyl synthetase family protein [Phycisphaeraceae bacterium]|nr:polyprenyl synthetase family protein [Phycisphaeraceae bacterium]
MPASRTAQHATSSPSIEVPAAAPSGEAESELPHSITAPIAQIDAYVSQYLDSTGLPENLVAAVRYALLGPGKRMRPLLVWHSCRAAGGEGTSALPAAAALELVHAFSLVHDDLPGLDNDDLRRGRPTLHRHTSEAMAILAGDAMLTLAMRVLVDKVAGEGLAGALVRELTEATAAMIAGQVFDTLGGFPRDGARELDAEHRLELIHHNKTGALIRASCRMGALCGLGDPSPDLTNPVLVALSTYSDSIGLMFQIVDDLLDVTQTTAHLGKKSGKDQDAGKLTYPGVFGIERSRQEVQRLHDQAIAAIAPLPESADPLRRLCSYMAVRSK